MKLYENIVIGNYLFDLGVQMAKRRPDLPLVSVSLLQQTPDDRLLADVLLANPGVCRLIEFKRTGKLTGKERKKLECLRSGVEKSNSPALAGRLSRQVHWFVEIKEPQMVGEKVNVRACPYLDVLSLPSFISQENFAHNAAEDACNEEPDLQERDSQRNYLQWVIKRFTHIDDEDEVADGRDSRKVNEVSTAFLVAINDKGQVHWLAVPNWIRHDEQS